MSKELFSIGEIARIKGVTIKALRFYDRIGLLKPYYVNPENQYRFYHINQFTSIDLIKAARALEISPKALVTLYENKDTKGLIELLLEHKEMAQKKIENLNATIQAIDHFSSSTDFAQSSNIHGDIYTRYIDSRHIFMLPFKEHNEEADYMVDYSELDVEVNQLGLMNLYDEGIIFEPIESGEYYPKNIFTSISSYADSEHYRHISAGTFLCICYGKDNVEEQLNKIILHLQENEIQPKEMLQVELTPDIFDQQAIRFEFQVRI